MKLLPILTLPALALLAACNSAPGNGTTQSESEAVPADDGAMSAPDVTSDTDGSNAAGTSGSMNQPGSTDASGTMAPSGSGPEGNGANSSGSTTGSGNGTSSNGTATGPGTGTSNNGTTDKGNATPPPGK